MMRLKNSLPTLWGLLTALLIGLVSASLVHALPQGGQVAAGQASISQPDQTTLYVTQSTDKAIINWRGFSISVNELVRFFQPSSSAIALNRVTGGEASQILGQLLANGRIFLINPSGIIFGAGARVDVGGLVATTLNISDANFMAGNYVFQRAAGNLASVINQGTITAAPGGFVALSAAGVQNQGTITARLGTVHLSSSEQLTVDFSGDGLVRFAVTGGISGQPVDSSGQPLSSRVSNEGRISADGGEVTLTAKAVSDVLISVVNNSGVIEARSLVTRGGVVQLVGGDETLEVATEAGAMRPAGEVAGVVTNYGTIDVSAAEPEAAPGYVLMAGERVGQWGTVLARGAENARGGDVMLTSAERTVVSGGSTTEVSGVGNSSAGTVRIWSDKDTYFTAGSTILARGGDTGGDGGFVEVSGKENLSFAGLVDAGAPHGNVGTLLLDPRNITVATGGTASLAQVDMFSDFPDTDFIIDPATISAATANVVLQANNDITVSNAVAMTNAGVGITMEAGRSIAINASISTNNGAISLTASGGSILAQSDAVLSGSSVTLRAGGTIGTPTAPISVAATRQVNADATGRVNMVSINISGSTGDSTLHFPGTVPGLVLFNERALSGSKGFDRLNSAIASTVADDMIRPAFLTFAARTEMALNPGDLLFPPSLFRLEDGGLLLPPSLRREGGVVMAAAPDTEEVVGATRPATPSVASDVGDAAPIQTAAVPLTPDTGRPVTLAANTSSSATGGPVTQLAEAANEAGIKKVLTTPSGGENGIALKRAAVVTTAAPSDSVAPQVPGKGRIPARVERVQLASGQQLAVDFSGDGLVRFAVDGVQRAERGEAEGSRVVLTANAAIDMLTRVVNRSGIAEAGALVNEGGVVRLVRRP